MDPSYLGKLDKGMYNPRAVYTMMSYHIQTDDFVLGKPIDLHGHISSSTSFTSKTPAKPNKEIGIFSGIVAYQEGTNDIL